MSTKFPPRTASDMLNKDRGNKDKSETERALDRSSTHSEEPRGEAPESGEDKLKRAAEQNDARKKDNG